MRIITLLTILLSLSNNAQAQREAFLYGKWKDISDTTNYLLISPSGEYRYSYLHTVFNERRTIDGKWKSKLGRGKISLYSNQARPRQDFLILKRWHIGWTLNLSSGGIVYVIYSKDYLLPPGERPPHILE